MASGVKGWCRLPVPEKKLKEEDDARDSVYASMKEKTKKKKADKQGKAEKKKGSKKAGKK